MRALRFPFRSPPQFFLQSSIHASTRRSMFIQVETTPNQHSLKFLPGEPVIPNGKVFEFSHTHRSSPLATSPLARKILAVPGIRTVLFGPDFISVNKAEEVEWGVIKPEIFAAIMDSYQSGNPIVSEDEGHDNPQQVEESEIVQMIKELLDSRIRPSVHEDGGDIEFVEFTQNGVVRLRMQGSCRGCSSSAITLKSGIENMMMHYIPEVKGVEQVLDEHEQQAEKEFEKLENALNNKK